MITINEKQAREALTLAERLRLAMAAKGIKSKAELARKVGTTRQTVGYWLDGSTKAIDSDNLYRVCAALGVRGAWLQEGVMPVYEPPKMREDTIQLVGFFENMTPERRQTLLEMAETFAAKSPTPPSPAVPYKSKARSK